ncbi:hypothetical protein [Rhizobium sp. 1399]|jgi:hypothetical protein|uniref:hypothetical protein n=1 Tax=Rhizobium sp. 1399 TaxID=2817758 RepID=UPI002865D096|nr:hypothetical protein [Rhizobium sp. 1399]MDR6667235.1 hypothetical protein [Rhizobium sp. 1399]
MPHCFVIITNGTPADWGVTIAGASVDFRHHDGTTENDTNNNANLSSGQSTTLRSQNNCVVHQHVVLRVLVDGDTQLFDRQYETPAGRCATENRVVLGPAANITSRTPGQKIEEFLQVSSAEKDDDR